MPTEDELSGVQWLSSKTTRTSGRKAELINRGLITFQVGATSVVKSRLIHVVETGSKGRLVVEKHLPEGKGTDGVCLPQHVTHQGPL